ncbi:branched-chain amino acid transaminase [Candidatus Woesearchaeota archaeon]|nr:branched-chain amino acid transaminase [Candidatus Woesearchaeota archaeon]
MKAWVNGKIVPWDEAKIHVTCHSLHYGTAVFEGIRFYKAEKGIAVFRLKEHVNRLFNSADALSMELKFSRNEIEEAVKKMVRANNFEEGYIRPLIFYGECLNVYPENVSVNCAIVISDFKNDKDGLKVKISRFKRINESATVSEAKISGNYANSVLAMEDVRRQGYDEALMLDEDGMVSEGPAHNLFIVKGALLLSPTSKSALQGITRDSILRIAEELGYTAIEQELEAEDIKEADEAFFCGTGSEIIWIKSIDDIGISDEIGEVTKKIKDKYFEIVKGKDKKFDNWLEYIS